MRGAVDELVGIDYSLLKDPVASTSNLDMEFRVSCPAGVCNRTPSFSPKAHSYVATPLVGMLWPQAQLLGLILTPC